MLGTLISSFYALKIKYFGGDTIHEFIYSCRQMRLDFDGFLMFAVMLDSKEVVDANSFFGTYVYHVASNLTELAVFDLDFKLQDDIEPLDLFSNIDFSSTFYVH